MKNNINKKLNIVKLSDVCAFVAGFAFKSGDFGNYPNKVIKITNIEPPFVNMDNLAGIDLSKYDFYKLARFLAKKGDYVLAMTGATIWKLGKVLSGNAYVNQCVLKFNPLPEVDKKFLYYVLSKNDFQRYILNHIDSESAQANISATTIGKYSFSLPPLDVQKKIAAVLEALDDKIELNKKINQNLEQQAQSLFKSWFVDFEPFGGSMPDDWKSTPFSETMQILSGGTPKTTEKEFWNGDIPWFSVVDAPKNIYVLDTEKHITEQGLQKSPCVLLEKNTVIISARGTVGKLAMTGKTMAMNQSCYGLKFDFPYYGYFLTKEMLSQLKQNLHGAVFDTITKDTFKAVETVVPSHSLEKAFSAIVKPFFEESLKLSEENAQLAELRDTLLPKLMSGEINVDNVKI